jgi:hypothetical protein
MASIRRMVPTWGAGALHGTPHTGLGEVGGESGRGDFHELSASLARGAFVQAPALSSRNLQVGRPPSRNPIMSGGPIEPHMRHKRAIERCALTLPGRLVSTSSGH